MTSERDKMIEALKEHVVTVMKARGFKGSFPHFRRPTDASIQLMTFQFDKWGGGFVVEIASCSVEGIALRPGEHVPPAKVTAHHVKDRLRLGAVDLNGDHWFRYDQRWLLGFGDPYLKAAREVLALLDSQAESFWNQN